MLEIWDAHDALTRIDAHLGDASFYGGSDGLCALAPLRPLHPRPAVGS